MVFEKTKKDFEIERDSSAVKETLSFRAGAWLLYISFVTRYETLPKEGLIGVDGGDERTFRKWKWGLEI